MEMFLHEDLLSVYFFFINLFIFLYYHLIHLIQSSGQNIPRMVLFDYILAPKEI